MQMDGRREATGEGDAVRRDQRTTDLNAVHCTRPHHAEDGFAGANRDADGSGLLDQGRGNLLAPVDDRDLGTGTRERTGDRIGGIIVRAHHDATARQDPPAHQIGLSRLRRHDARPVIVREDERPFDRPGREDDLTGADIMQPIWRPARRLDRAALDDADQAVVVDAKGGRPEQERDT
jgi:hypothetical protein